MSRPVDPVRGRQTFAALRRSNRRAADSTVRVHFAPATDLSRHHLQVAYAINRKVGGAVERNRWRRRLRAIVADAAGELAPGAYLIGLSPGVRELSFDELRERVTSTMRRATETRR